MGCAQSAEGNNKQNGENLVGPNEPPAPAPPDPRLPLTARQKYSMVASWKGISRAMETTGINMFIKWVFIFFFYSNKGWKVKDFVSIYSSCHFWEMLYHIELSNHATEY